MKTLLKLLLTLLLIAMSGCEVMDGEGSGYGETVPLVTPPPTIEDRIVFELVPAYGSGIDWNAAEIVLLRSGMITLRLYYPDYCDGESRVEEYSSAFDAKIFEELEAAVCSAEFVTLPDDIATDVLDGDYTYISIYAVNGSYRRIGGIGAAWEGPEAFTDVCRRIIELADAKQLFSRARMEAWE